MSAWKGSTWQRPANWDALVAQVKRRSGGRCEVVKGSTGRRCPNPANGGVDHVVPKHKGGTDDLTNLAHKCHFHHGQKTAAEGNAAKAEKKALRNRPAEEHPGQIRRRNHG